MYCDRAIRNSLFLRIWTAVSRGDVKMSQAVKPKRLEIQPTIAYTARVKGGSSYEFQFLNYFRFTDYFKNREVSRGQFYGNRLG